MAPLRVFIAAILPLLLYILPVSAGPDLAAQRFPLGGSLLKFESRNLLPRAGGDIGNDCGGDPACTTTDYGCQCGFTDGSWITEKPEGGDGGDGGDGGGGGDDGGQCRKAGGKKLFSLLVIYDYVFLLHRPYCRLNIFTLSIQHHTTFPPSIFHVRV